VDPLEIIERHYGGNPAALRVLVEHSRMVAARALEIARSAARAGLEADEGFVREAAMLHDIGIIGTRAPRLGCGGEDPYIRHGIIGRRMLEAEGLPRHALVCERHVGLGISGEEVRLKGLPLPARDMVPVTLEEKIVCLADKFYSKDGDPMREIPLEAVRRLVAGYGAGKLETLERWLRDFGLS